MDASKAAGSSANVSKLLLSALHCAFVEACATVNEIADKIRV